MVNLRKISDYEWQIEKRGAMKVPATLYASEKLVTKIRQDRTLEQLRNMACLPGIYKHAVALPDAHQGYGFSIGGVAALDLEEGGISPGGVGYDINCGVRLARTSLTQDSIRHKIRDLVEAFYRNIPAGVGSKGRIGRLSWGALKELLSIGPVWAVENGYGEKEDIELTEDEGKVPADPSFVSERALKRGIPQSGSLGAGNHFLEIQAVERILDEEVAKKFGLFKDQVVVMIHSGSRGLGHQVCSDYLREMERTQRDLIARLPDRELVYAPGGSEMANRYYKAMGAAANYAWTNRQVMLHQVRESFEQFFPGEEVHQVYDVAHNIAKIEEHRINGETKKCYVHRKGATRSFPPGHPSVPSAYRSVGQPILLPGSMGTASYVLVGTQQAMEKSFGSTAHGAGRVLSRRAATRRFRGEKVRDDLKTRNIHLMAHSWKVVAEEAPHAYKDINEVARVSDAIGIGKLVAKLRPMGVVKG